MVDSNKFQAKVSIECSFFETCPARFRLNAKLLRARCSFWKPVQHDMLFGRWKQILFYTNTTHGKLVKPPTTTFQ